MKMKPFSLYRRLAFASLAIASFSALTACSKPASHPVDKAQQGATSQPSASAPVAGLLPELPEPYRAWPRQSAPLTACGFDSIRKNPDGSLAINGWAVIEAAAGVVPESFVLQLDKDGTTSYVATQPAERKDIAEKLGNAALVRSGFTVSLKSDVIKPPFTGTMIIGFDQRLFTCEYKLQA